MKDEVEYIIHTFYQNIYSQYKTQQTKGGGEEEGGGGEDKTTATVQIGNSSFSL